MIETPAYFGLLVTDDTESKIDNVLVDNGYEDKDFSDEYHVTLIYSEKHIKLNIKDKSSLPSIVSIDKVTGVVTGYELFGAEKEIFVLKIESDEIVNLHNELMKKTEASYPYPEYIPHVTIYYNIPDDVEPDKLYSLFKGMSFEFDSIRIEELDEYKYDDDDQ